MMLSSNMAIISIAFPIIIAMFCMVIRNMYTRISDMDRRIRTSLSDREVRRLIDDKIDPIREDIHEIKIKLEKLLD